MRLVILVVEKIVRLKLIDEFFFQVIIVFLVGVNINLALVLGKSNLSVELSVFTHTLAVLNGAALLILSYALDFLDNKREWQRLDLHWVVCVFLCKEFWNDLVHDSIDVMTLIDRHAGHLVNQVSVSRLVVVA